MDKELVDLYPITLKEYVASRSYLRLYEFEYCPLTFIYNTVMCSVAIYNGTETDSLIIEVHNKNTRFGLTGLSISFLYASIMKMELLLFLLIK